MKFMKTGKKIKVDNFKNYNIVYGSINNKVPKAVYLTISSWAEPETDIEINYNRVIRDINKRIKQVIYNWIESNNANIHKHRTIVDLDMRESGVRYLKRSFINCEITLFLIEEMSFITDEMLDDINKLLKVIIHNGFEYDKYFTFNKKKK